MPKGIMVVQSRPTDPSREDEFNEWYSKVHLPELLDVPGFTRARRYKVAAGADPAVREYVTVYEIEADDLHAPMKELRARGKAGQTHSTDAVQGDPPPVITIYELIDDQSSND